MLLMFSGPTPRSMPPSIFSTTVIFSTTSFWWVSLHYHCISLAVVAFHCIRAGLLHSSCCVSGCLVPAALALPAVVAAPAVLTRLLFVYQLFPFHCLRCHSSRLKLRSWSTRLSRCSDWSYSHQLLPPCALRLVQEKKSPAACHAPVSSTSASSSDRNRILTPLLCFGFADLFRLYPKCALFYINSLRTSLIIAIPCSEKF